MKKVKLPKRHVMIMENEKAVLAHNETKEEYVAWTKDVTGGVCWGVYIPYWYDTSQEEALQRAIKAYNKK